MRVQAGLLTRGAALQPDADKQTVAARQVKIEYCTEEKLATESICSALIRKAKALKLDFVALGVYGTVEENKSLYVAPLPPCWVKGRWHLLRRFDPIHPH